MFKSREFCVKFLVGKVMLEQFFLQVLWFSSVSYHSTDVRRHIHSLANTLTLTCFLGWNFIPWPATWFYLEQI